MDADYKDDAIQRQMKETRASLTEKLESLEQKVVGSVEGATTAVNETVAAIKETVQDTVSTVNETMKDGMDSVKDMFDMPAHVQQHPWLVVGGSVAVGYYLGSLIAPRDSQPHRSVQAYTTQALPPPPASAPAGIGSMQTFFAPEISKLKGLALGMLFGTAREMLASSVPGQLGDQLKDVLDSFTKKAGGEPLPSSTWDGMRKTESQHSADNDGMEDSAESRCESSEGGNGRSGARRW